MQDSPPANCVNGHWEWQWGFPCAASMWLVLPPITEKRLPDVESPQQAQHHCAQLLCRQLAVLQLGLQPAHSNAGGPAAINGTALHKYSSFCESVVAAARLLGHRICVTKERIAPLYR